METRIEKELTQCAVWGSFMVLYGSFFGIWDLPYLKVESLEFKVKGDCK